MLANADGSANMANVIAGDAARDRGHDRFREGFFTSFEGHIPGAGRGEPHHRLFSRLLSLALIFAILYSRYRSAVLALIIMGSVPLALIGSVAALWIAGQPLSVASMVGFITLTGIATRNGILKISATTSISRCMKACPSGPTLSFAAAWSG